MELNIYDNQLVEPAIFAAVGIIILVILTGIIYLFIRKLVKKWYDKIELMAITDCKSSKDLAQNI